MSQTQYKASTTILDAAGALTASIEGTPTVTEGGAATFTISLSAVADEMVSVGSETSRWGILSTSVRPQSRVRTTQPSPEPWLSRWVHHLDHHRPGHRRYPGGGL